MPDPFFLASALIIAPLLLGREFSLTPDGPRWGIIETEAYTQDDPASHSFKGCTHRCQTMFAPGGVVYVYLIYGVYFCMNFVTGPENVGEAVLIRGIEAVDGTIQIIGPGKVCRHLGITLEHNHLPINGDPLLGGLALHSPSQILNPQTILTTPRIGITKGVGLLRRFLAPSHPEVKRHYKKFPPLEAP